MKVLFDTSVIIGALLPKHQSHSSCFIQLQTAQSGQIQGCLSTHSLAELYSVMTRMPVQPRMSPKEANTLLERCLQYLDAIPLDTADYQYAIAQMTALNLPGGGIFDALIARAALKASADRILTLNPGHFTRLDPAIARMTQVP
ncbi:MAG: type II toxin-antitoxin system VapC family toxin [Acaryochloridaceae cyanobacterium RU_4_10]|nr:type II toxin-antitoxin system VapC family toxin [Acaryochloridaceae cyanobacterium RU_4_10]